MGKQEERRGVAEVRREESKGEEEKGEGTDLTDPSMETQVVP